jgi:hypothetical protein
MYERKTLEVFLFKDCKQVSIGVVIRDHKGEISAAIWVYLVDEMKLLAFVFRSCVFIQKKKKIEKTKLRCNHIKQTKTKTQSRFWFWLIMFNNYLKFSNFIWSILYLF